MDVCLQELQHSSEGMSEILSIFGLVYLFELLAQDGYIVLINLQVDVVLRPFQGILPHKRLSSPEFGYKSRRDKGLWIKSHE